MELEIAESALGAVSTLINTGPRRVCAFVQHISGNCAEWISVDQNCHTSQNECVFQTDSTIMQPGQRAPIGATVGNSQSIHTGNANGPQNTIIQ